MSTMKGRNPIRKNRKWESFVPGYLSISDLRKMGMHSSKPEDTTVWMNNLYQVVIRKNVKSGEGWVPMTHLSIKRIDKRNVVEWRDFQRIKNELLGPEYEAVQIFPKESRLVDNANQYHLWAFPSDKFAFPFGFANRMVTEFSLEGSVQLPWYEDEVPADLVSEGEFMKKVRERTSNGK